MKTKYKIPSKDQVWVKKNPLDIYNKFAFVSNIYYNENKIVEHVSYRTSLTPSKIYFTHISFFKTQYYYMETFKKYEK